MDKSKYKKHINVSLQNKKYYDSINPVLLKWADSNENMSEKVSESILMAVRLESSIGINKLMNTFEMIEKTLQIYFPEKNNTYNEAVEKAFAKIVNVNGAMLSDFITNPVQFSEAQLQPAQKPEPVDSTTTNPIKEDKPVMELEVKKETKQEVKEAEEPVTHKNESSQITDDAPKKLKTEAIHEEKQNKENNTTSPTSEETLEVEKSEQEHIQDEPKEDEGSKQENLPEETNNDDEDEDIEITDDDVSLLFGS